MNKLAIIARVSLSEASAPAYIEAIGQLTGPTRAEPGCDLYGIAVDVNDPTVVWISEQWDSQDALNEHLKTEHVQAFMAIAANLEILDMDARQYEVSSIGPVVIPE